MKQTSTVKTKPLDNLNETHDYVAITTGENGEIIGHVWVPNKEKGDRKQAKLRAIPSQSEFTYTTIDYTKS